MAIKEGDIIKVEYTGKLDDGTIFDSTEKQGGEPLKFEVGGGKIIPGFDKSVVGKEVGEEFEIRLEPSEAYGEYQEGLIQNIPKDQFPDNNKIQEGSMIILRNSNNQQIPAVVNEITDESVELDLNHPMAGKTLNFKIKIVEVDSESNKGS